MTTTELYIIRHGIAAERGTYENDGDRPLTEAGIRRTQLVAQRLEKLGFQFSLILSSPLKRALQTAEILQEAGLSSVMETSEHLLPDANFEDWFTWFESWQNSHRQPLAIVGHEPELSELAEWLMWGEVRQQLMLKKAGIVGLNVPLDDPIGNSQLFWLTPPRFFV